MGELARIEESLQSWYHPPRGQNRSQWRQMPQQALALNEKVREGIEAQRERHEMNEKILNMAESGVMEPGPW